jgi:hypothetical protein
MNELREEVYEAWGIKSKIGQRIFSLVILDPIVFLIYWVGFIHGTINRWKARPKPMKNEDDWEYIQTKENNHDQARRLPEETARTRAKEDSRESQRTWRRNEEKGKERLTKKGGATRPSPPLTHTPDREGYGPHYIRSVKDSAPPMLVITLSTEELDILQKLKPDIYDILATIQSTGREKKTFLLPRDKAKQIVLNSRNKDTLRVWNQFSRQLKEKFHHLHRNFYNLVGTSSRESWCSYINRKYKIQVGHNLELLDIP